MVSKISLVVPVYNEARNIAEFYTRLKETLSKLSLAHEIIFVDDNSNDGSLTLLQSIKSRDSDVKIIDLNQRQGQIRVYLQAFKQVTADTVVTIDADLQYEPQDLPKFLDKINAGFDFVSGRRAKREDSLMRKTLSFLESWLINLKTGKNIHDWGCGFNAFKSELLPLLDPYYPKNIVLLKPLMVRLAKRPAEIAVRHYRRQGDCSKYSIFSIILTGIKFLFLGEV